VVIAVGQAHFEDGTMEIGIIDAVQQLDMTAMRAHDVGGNRETEAGPAGAHRAMEWLEQTFARGRRQARAIVGSVD
jgi:hypothetical protein